MKKYNDYKPGCFTRSLFYIFCIFVIYYFIKLIIDYPEIGVISTIIVLLVVSNILDYKNKKRKRSLHYQNLYDTLKEMDDEEDKGIIIPSAEETKKYHKEIDIPKTPIKEVPLINNNYKLPKLNSFVKDEKIKSIFASNRNDINLLMKKSYGYDLFNVKKSSSLLIYGMIGSGKSNLIHNIIFSGLLCKKPDELKIVIIDTRKLEFNEYTGIPHLKRPIVKDVTRIQSVLDNIIREMDDRLNLLLEYKCKNIWEYNTKVSKQKENNKKLPNILLIIDELNDVLMYDKNIFDNLINRILIDGRITGINIICTLNTLDYSIITRSMISSFENVISFRTTSERESRLLFNNEELVNLQDNEYKYKHKGIDSKYTYTLENYTDNRIIDYVKSQQKNINDDIVLKNKAENIKNDNSDIDPLYDEIVDYCIQTGKVSASLLQRKFRFGYNRAARIVDILEERGIIGPQNGSSPREVLIKIKVEDDE